MHPINKLLTRYGLELTRTAKVPGIFGKFMHNNMSKLKVMHVNMLFQKMLATTWENIHKIHVISSVPLSLTS